MGIFCNDGNLKFAVGHVLKPSTGNTEAIVFSYISEHEFIGMLQIIDSEGATAKIGYEVLGDGKIRIDIFGIREHANE